MNQRKAYIDYLRVIAAFAVVWLHVSADVAARNPDPHAFAWWVGNVAQAFSRWCVPIFVMVSGDLLLANDANSDPGLFYKKTFRRLSPVLAFWTILYFLYRFYTEAEFNLSVGARDLIGGMPYYHLWYLYMLIGLFFSTPFICRIVTTYDKRVVLLLMLFCFLLSALETGLGGKSVTFLARFLQFIGYFVAGYYASNFSPRYRTSSLVLVVIGCGVLVALSVGALVPVLGGRAGGLIYSYHDPLVVIMSISIFLLCRQTNPPLGPFRGIAPITLGIYIIHPMWIWFLSKNGITSFYLHPIVGIPTVTVLAFVLSALCAGLMAQLPFLRRTIS